MKRRLHCIAVCMITLILLSLRLFGQQTTVIGVLRSASGEPLSGATITIKGANRSTATNANGEFSINASPGNTLVISHVGYETKEQTVGSENDLNIYLATASSNMEEVVVVG